MQVALYALSTCCVVLNFALGGRGDFLRAIAVGGVSAYVVVSSFAGASTKPLQRATDALLAFAVLFLYKPIGWTVIAVVTLVALSSLEFHRKLSVSILGCFLLFTQATSALV